jgi:hypothetical protein
MLQKLYRMLEMNFQDEHERETMAAFARRGVYDFVEKDLSESESEEQVDSVPKEVEYKDEDERELEQSTVWAP